VEPQIFSGNLERIPSIDLIKIPPPMGRNLRGRTLIAAAPETPPFIISILALTMPPQAVL